MENNEQQVTKQEEFNKTAFLDSFMHYKMTEEAEKDFRGFTKQGKNAEKNIIEKRLSVLIHTSYTVTAMPNNKCRYQFGDLVILTNESEHTIDVVYWVKRRTKITGAMKNELKQKFNTIGLDDTGFELLKEEDRE